MLPRLCDINTIIDGALLLQHECYKDEDCLAEAVQGGAGRGDRGGQGRPRQAGIPAQVLRPIRPDRGKLEGGERGSLCGGGRGIPNIPISKLQEVIIHNFEYNFICRTRFRVILSVDQLNGQFWLQACNAVKRDYILTALAELL